jgi:serine phosphatase RsbU (regulator of sigma subunit)
MLLSASGLQVHSVADGKSAPPACTTPPDLVLLDVILPDLSGLEILDAIRVARLDSAVIMTTAFGSEEIAVDALRRGADDYLRKPLVLRDFQAVLQRTASRLELKRMNAALQHELDAKHKQLKAELARAAEIQSDLLRTNVPVIPGFEFAARFMAAREVSGDFYDWQMPAPGIFNFMIADVMGKGISAALLMATARAALRSVVRSSSPAEAMQYVSSALENDFEKSGSFLTLFLAQLDAPNHRLAFVDAGHGHVFLLRANGSIQSLEPRGLPLGIFANQAYREGAITFEPDDTLVMYSDGLIQATHDMTPLQLAAQIHGARSAQGMVDCLTRQLSCDSPLEDDLTAVILRREATI